MSEHARRLILASANPGKQREFAELLAPLGIELMQFLSNACRLQRIFGGKKAHP